MRARDSLRIGPKIAPDHFRDQLNYLIWQARIQQWLFQLFYKEGRHSDRGFKLPIIRLRYQFVFDCQPEDYTNRGSIVDPLEGSNRKSGFITHYPKHWRS